ncbi:NAD-dependent epimerase/dehydratase family protein [Marinactinospora rubrisoli]|uniref:NAD-dependent epimerase/dehydratase family protein n=1 Tax=Marinactinospora rubrisoli TaxID=2715399 RepID=A0ABW2KNU8_9ACTN
MTRPPAAPPAPRVAVLGATGCVGRQVCAEFARHGAHVLAVARRPAPHTAPHSFHPLDVAAADPADTARLLHDARVDAVVNATGGWGSTEEEMTYAHVRLVDRLVTALARLPHRPRVVQVGSVHEYGPVTPGTLIGETTPARPTSAYGRTKLAGTDAVLAATRAGDVDGVVLRVVNVCGPHPPPASFLGTLVHRLRAAAPGDDLSLTVADARRDYVDVRDVAEAVRLAATAPATGRVINIGRGEAAEVGELVRLLLAAADLPAGPLRTGTGVASKGGDWTRADIRLAARLLGWRPRTDLPASIAAMWAASAP